MTTIASAPPYDLSLPIAYEVNESTTLALPEANVVDKKVSNIARKVFYVLANILAFGVLAAILTFMFPALPLLAAVGICIGLCFVINGVFSTHIAKSSEKSETALMSADFKNPLLGTVHL